MKVRVLLFAQLKEAYGADFFWLDLPESSTIQDAVGRMMREKKLNRFRELPLRYAVNEEFQSETRMLSDNDSLALLSPVAGG